MKKETSIKIRRMIAGVVELGMLPYAPTILFSLTDQIYDYKFTPLNYIFWLLVLWYLICKDSLFGGQSLMKKLLGVKVVDFDSSAKCTLRQSIIRNILFWLPLAFFVEIIWIYGEPKGRRMGDYLANTIVVDAE
jgi:uncharacterized RDD family membrane protein YckC